MTNILATIGPITANNKAISFIAKNTNLFRLNGSHGSMDWHKQTVSKIRSVCPDAFILMDIPGIKPRTANETRVEVKKNEALCFGDCAATDFDEFVCIPLTKKIPNIRATTGQFSINDGQFIFDLMNDLGDAIIGRSHQKFWLEPKKGLNLPGSVYDEIEQERVYLNFIEKLGDIEVDGLGLSFVQTGTLVNRIKSTHPNYVLVSKIENSMGFENRSDIISASDAIMIDRGDLGAEIGMENLFHAVEAISSETKSSGKPLIMATENLDSMIKRKQPSKSEVISLGHSVNLGVDCIMLSEETAVSNNFVNTVNWLVDFLEKTKFERKPLFCSPIKKKFPDIWRCVENLNIPAVLFTHNGYAMFELLSTSPDLPSFVFTNNRKIKKLLNLYNSKLSLRLIDFEDEEPALTVHRTVDRFYEEIFKDYDEIAAIFVSKQFPGARANSITFIKKDSIRL